VLHEDVTVGPNARIVVEKAGGDLPPRATRMGLR